MKHGNRGQLLVGVIPAGRFKCQRIVLKGQLKKIIFAFKDY